MFYPGVDFAGEFFGVGGGGVLCSVWGAGGLGGVVSVVSFFALRMRRAGADVAVFVDPDPTRRDVSPRFPSHCKFPLPPHHHLGIV